MVSAPLSPIRSVSGGFWRVMGCWVGSRWGRAEWVSSKRCSPPKVFRALINFCRILDAQNLVVKFDGEICGGALVENASDDFPQQKKLENRLPNFAGSSPPISPKTSPTSLWKSVVLTSCHEPKCKITTREATCTNAGALS